MDSTPEWRNVDLKTLREEIIPRDRPAVLKGLLENWPLMRSSAQSPQALFDYVRARDLGRPIGLMVGRPEIKGLYFYRDDTTGLNFEFAQHTFQGALETVLTLRNQSNPSAIYTGAIAVAENFPQIGRENALELIDQHLAGKPPAKTYLWLGNAVTMATHYDNLDGINCIVAGRKRFTFFPPDQFPNLYIGPLDLGPAGQPISLVKVASPDFERFPRFAQALSVAETADVEPGDAIFIPKWWWHNVESLEPLNLSMNYWWFEGPKGGAEPFGALVHGLLAITALPPEDRELWRQMFDHYVFRTNGDPVPYLQPERRGILGPESGPLSPPIAGFMRAQLIRSLAKQLPGHIREPILQLMTPKPQ